MDFILIDALRVDTVIGIFDWEKQFEQPLYFDIKIQTDLSLAGKTDDIKQTVSYKEVCDEVILWCAEHQYELLETLAEDLCRMLFTQFSGINAITLGIQKPHAVPKAKSVGIQIHRNR